MQNLFPVGLNTPLPFKQFFIMWKFNTNVEKLIKSAKEVKALLPSLPPTHTQSLSTQRLAYMLTSSKEQSTTSCTYVQKTSAAEAAALLLPKART